MTEGPIAVMDDYMGELKLPKRCAKKATVMYRELSTANTVLSAHNSAAITSQSPAVAPCRAQDHRRPGRLTA